MLIGNKLFPYPVLNRNKELSQYKDSSTFFLTFDTDGGELIKTKTDIIFKNVRFVLKNEGLEALYIGRYIACAMIVECSSSAYRKKFTISDLPQDILIPIGDLSGNVVVSAYLFAQENIPEYANNEFDPDYEGYSFNIEKYDILAVDDGVRFNIDTNPDSDNKVPSIFTIVKQNGAGNEMSYQSTQNRINICLSPTFYADYDNIKNSPEFNNIMFGLLAIPALSSCIFEIKANIDEFGDVEDIFESQRWFKAVCLAYKRETKKELTLEELADLNPVVLSQIVLNDATCNGLRDFSNFIIQGNQAARWGDEVDE